MNAFEVLLGWYAAVYGLLSLAAVGGGQGYERVMPVWAAGIFEGGYLVSGLGILAGVAAARADIEAGGLVLLAALQATLAVLAIALVGLGFGALTLTLAVLVIAASVARLWLLLARPPGPGDV